MNCTYSQIRSFALGAEEAVETELGLSLYRFNEEELEVYGDRFGEKPYATAGIRLAFTTDASSLTLGLHAAFGGSSRTYFAAELFEDGARSGILKNYNESDSFETMRDHCPLGDFEKTFPLKAGKKQVELYLPWSVIATVTKLELEDASFAEPIERNSVLLMYGDSITHGYDAALPSQSYSNRLADALGMQVFNKAIGGEVFFPPLAECQPTLAPDLITVAYGTNDWSKTDLETLTENSRAFYEALAERHPDTPILAITPIWRKDWEKETAFGSFHEVEEAIRAIAEGIPQMKVVRGFEFVPHDATLFADLSLHPNDKGFAYYAENLTRLIQPLLEE